MGSIEITETSLIGWFSDLPFGYPTFPTIRDSRDSIEVGNRSRVAKYAASGHPFAAGDVFLTDVMNPDHVIDATLSILTDGEFVWRSDLAHYVLAYGVAVPDRFVSKAVSLGATPELSEAEIFRISESYLTFVQSYIPPE